MNYENVRNMYFQRRNHKLTEWSESFIKWVESLPYAEELIMYDGRSENPWFIRVLEDEKAEEMFIS